MNAKSNSNKKCQPTGDLRAEIDSVESAESEERELAEKEAVEKNEMAYRSAYPKHLNQLVRSRIPDGIEFPGDEWYDGPIPRSFQGWAEDDIEYFAIDKALSEADLIANNLIRISMEEQRRSICDVLDVECDLVESMLLHALWELGANTASICVEVWLGFQVHHLPRSWSDLSELITKNPELSEIGPQEMMERGFIPPPWVTAEMT